MYGSWLHLQHMKHLCVNVQNICRYDLLSGCHKDKPVFWFCFFTLTFWLPQRQTRILIEFLHTDFLFVRRTNMHSDWVCWKKEKDLMVSMITFCNTDLWLYLHVTRTYYTTDSVNPLVHAVTETINTLLAAYTSRLMVHYNRNCSKTHFCKKKRVMKGYTKV